MVRRVPKQPEQKILAEFSALMSDKSHLLATIDGDPSRSVWQCEVNQLPGGVGYWIGSLPEFCAYLVVRPIDLDGVTAVEAVRGWVDPECRGQGLFSELLRHASNEGVALANDREGMTDDAYRVWTNASGFIRRYYHTETRRLVEETVVPHHERFAAWGQGGVWLLVLFPEVPSL